MNHFMIDMETLGTGPRAVVMSVGLCVFTKHGFDHLGEFYLDIDSQVKAGRSLDGDTLAWWGKQSGGFIKILKKCKDGIKYPKFCDTFSKTIDACERKLNGTNIIFEEQKNNSFLWSNGADFDIPILQDLYKETGNKYPFNFWNHCCFRTIKSLFKSEIKQSGIINEDKHDALSDAKHQARILLHLSGKGLIKL